MFQIKGEGLDEINILCYVTVLYDEVTPRKIYINLLRLLPASC
jgi:hypothetical protein